MILYGQILNHLCFHYIYNYEEYFKRTYDFINDSIIDIFDEIHFDLLINNLIDNELVEKEILEFYNSSVVVYKPTETALKKYKKDRGI
jgi:hypothetical protein